MLRYWPFAIVILTLPLWLIASLILGQDFWEWWADRERAKR